MLLIGPGFVLTPNGLLADAGVASESGKIVAVGPFADLKTAHADAEVLDADGGVILPGLIDAHTRLYAAFARGLAPDVEPRNARDWYEQVLWRLDRALEKEDVEISAKLGLIAAAKAGVTTVIDHHSSPGCVENSLDVVADAVDEVGLRACLCHDVSDRNGEAVARQAMAENLRFMFASRKRASGRVRGVFGLHASSTIGPSTANRFQTICFVAGPGTVTHLNLGEDALDTDDARQKYGAGGVVERLRHNGVLNGTTLAAHAVNLSDEELDELAALGVRVVHLPRMNMKTGVGRARIEAMQRRNIVVGLGTAGVDGDVLAEMKAAAMLYRHSVGGATSGQKEARALLFENNPKIAAGLLPKAPSSLAVNAPADVAVFDYKPITPLTPENFLAHLFDGITAAHVVHTVCDGRVVMKNRQLTRIDEAEVVARARELAPKAWERMRAKSSIEKLPGVPMDALSTMH